MTATTDNATTTKTKTAPAARLKGALKAVACAAMAAALAASMAPATALASDSSASRLAAASVKGAQAGAPDWVSKGYGTGALTSFTTSEVALSGGRWWQRVKVAGDSVVFEPRNSSASANTVPGSYIDSSSDGDGRKFGFTQVARVDGKLRLGLDGYGKASASCADLRKKMDAKLKPSDYDGLPGPMKGYVAFTGESPTKNREDVTKSDLAYISKAAKAAVKGCTTDVQKAERLFFEWLPKKFDSRCSGGSVAYDRAKLVKSGKVNASSYEVDWTYAWMLRAVGVPAVYIRGAGATGSWCAAYLGGHWRFIAASESVYRGGTDDDKVARGLFCASPEAFGMSHMAMWEGSPAWKSEGGSAAKAISYMLTMTAGVNSKKAASSLKSQSIKATAKAGKAKASALKKAGKKVTAVAVKGAKTKVTFKKASGSKRLSVDKATGKVRVAKGTKKGTYKMVVKATAAKTSKYKAASAKATVKVRVV